MRYDNYCLEGTVLFVMWPLSWNCVWTLVAGPNYLLKKGAQDKYKKRFFQNFSLFFESERETLHSSAIEKRDLFFFGSVFF